MKLAYLLPTLAQLARWVETRYHLQKRHHTDDQRIGSARFANEKANPTHSLGVATAALATSSSISLNAVGSLTTSLSQITSTGFVRSDSMNQSRAATSAESSKDALQALFDGWACPESYDENRKTLTNKGSSQWFRKSPKMFPKWSSN